VCERVCPKGVRSADRKIKAPQWQGSHFASRVPNGLQFANESIAWMNTLAPSCINIGARSLSTCNNFILK
jgi:hypothetical protein